MTTASAIAPGRSRALPSPLIQTMAILALMAACTSQASAAGFSDMQNQTISAAGGGGAANTVTQNTYGLLKNVAQILSGPIMWIVMVFVIIFGGWQFSQGKLQAGFICVGSFLLMAGMSYFFSIVAAS